MQYYMDQKTNFSEKSFFKYKNNNKKIEKEHIQKIIKSSFTFIYI